MSFGPSFSRVGHYFWAMEFLFEEKDVFNLKTAVHFNAEAQGRKVTRRKSGLL